MPAELVVDASVVAKCFFQEVGTDRALDVLRSGARLVAPEFLHAEFASIAAKKARRGDVAPAMAGSAVDDVGSLLAEVFPAAALSGRAFALSVETGCSAFDGLYLALAEARGCRVVTADARLVRNATSANLSHLIQAL